jgi:thiamine biosynthesis protein ThiI
MSSPAPPTPERPYVFLVRLSGELSIKAKMTRSRFTNTLVENLADALASAGIDAELRRSWSRIFITAESEETAEVVARVFGVSSVSRVECRPWTSYEQLLDLGEELFREEVTGRKFAVRTRRGDKRHIHFGSGDVDRALGARLLPYAAGVDLTQPEVTVNVEVQVDHVYFFSSKVAGPAGLPQGEGGRAVSLVSGGFDSIVASWLLLRRGVQLDYVFCNLGGTPHLEGTLKVLKVLSDRWSYGSRPRLHILDFQPIVEELKKSSKPRYYQVVLKRQMLRAAERVARQGKAMAIVTGDSVGQVSSQTLANLAVISGATALPVLRPLAGSNKDEIFAWARHIGSFELSALVPEYCALTAEQPATKASLKRVVEAEQGLDPNTIYGQVSERMVLDLRGLDLDRLEADEWSTTSIPEEATILDLRTPTAFASWHYPEATRLDYFEALKAYRSFDRTKTYLFYCEVAIKSAHLAELMRREGFTAFHFKDGLKELLRLYESQDPALKAALSPVLLD